MRKNMKARLPLLGVIRRDWGWLYGSAPGNFIRQIERMTGRGCRRARSI